jgi:hypothetical protein
MGVRCLLAFAIASMALCTLGAQCHEAAARGEFRHDVAAPLNVSETVRPAKKHKPVSQAQHKAKKAATAAVSGVQRIAKRITDTVAALFDGDEIPPRPITVPNARITAPSSVGTETAKTAPQRPGRHPLIDEAVSAPNINEHPKCQKAKGKVGKYAFVDVEALSCEGEVYRFSATREGKRFEVRVRAANGELLGVEKLEPAPPVNETRPSVVPSQAQARP